MLLATRRLLRFLKRFSLELQEVQESRGGCVLEWLCLAHASMPGWRGRTDSNCDVACRRFNASLSVSFLLQRLELKGASGNELLRRPGAAPSCKLAPRGFGLIDSRGALVDKRTAAVSCHLCPLGTSSTSLIDEAAGTRRSLGLGDMSLVT